MKHLILPLLLLSACAPSDLKPTITAEVIADGFMFTEGPVWSEEGFLLFSDIPANVVYRWSEAAGVDTFLTPSGRSNGLVFHPSGRLVLAQHDGTVSMLSDEGKMQTMAQWVGGMRLNSPNDLVLHPSGVLFFTDPPFGVSDEDRMLEYSGVYRLAPDGELTLVFDGFELPNGIAFSPDFSRLYVCDSRTGDIVAWDVDASGHATNPTPFANIGAMTDKGGADGMKTDSKGRLFTTGPNGLIVFDASGSKLLRVEFAEQVTNLAWGGAGDSILFMTASDKIYRLSVQ
jgi:gluconolactonase